MSLSNNIHICLLWVRWKCSKIIIQLKINLWLLKEELGFRLLWFTGVTFEESRRTIVFFCKWCAWILIGYCLVQLFSIIFFSMFWFRGLPLHSTISILTRNELVTGHEVSFFFLLELTWCVWSVDHTWWVFVRAAICVAILVTS